MAIIQSGSFTQAATAVNKQIKIRSDFDAIRVYNYSNIDTTGGAVDLGVEFYFQKGMTSGQGLVWVKQDNEANDPITVDVLAANTGFIILDTSGSPLASLNSTVTDISTAAIPVATNSGTNGLVAGDVVRIYNAVDAEQLSGFDFTVGYNTLTTTTFSLDYMSQLGTAADTADWRRIKFDPLYYPRHRYITKVTKASQAVVTLSVTHGYKVGQEVKFVVPSIYDMVELDGLQGTITAIDETTTTGNTITVDIDSTNFTTFAFPSAADFAAAGDAFSKAMVVPIGLDTAQAISSSVDLLSDATDNRGFIGVELVAGVTSPGGSDDDVIYYLAEKNDITVNP